jgi:ribosomal subunit interface protein
MHIQFVSKGIDVSPALRERIEARVEEGTAKYFSRPAEAFVVATKEGAGFKVDCSVHLPSGVFIQAQGSAADAYAAVEEAVTHLEKRLRRYKRRLKDHQANNKSDLPAETTPVFVLRGGEYEPDDAEEDDGGAEAGDEPVIVAETPGELRTLTVSMAVLDMDLADAPFVLFKNASHGGLNIVYRRPDGHVGWIDPARGAKDGAEQAAE